MLTVRIDRVWDEALFCTRELRPASSAAALLTWEMNASPVDEGVPGPVIDVVSHMAASMGPVAFRLFFRENLPENLSIILRPRRWLLRRILERLGRRWPTEVAIAVDPHGVAELFVQDWHLQGQAALVLCSADMSGDTLDRLRYMRNWSGREFPRDARLLIAPAADGDGILLAVSNAAAMDRVLGLLANAFSNAGLICRLQI